VQQEPPWSPSRCTGGHGGLRTGGGSIGSADRSNRAWAQRRRARDSGLGGAKWSRSRKSSFRGMHQRQQTISNRPPRAQADIFSVAKSFRQHKVMKKPVTRHLAIQSHRRWTEHEAKSRAIHARHQQKQKGPQRHRSCGPHAQRIGAGIKDQDSREARLRSRFLQEWRLRTRTDLGVISTSSSSSMKSTPYSSVRSIGGVILIASSLPETRGSWSAAWSAWH
jgi:hypothetical protein